MTFGKGASWPDGRPIVYSSQAGGLPIDYPEPEDARGRCFHCGRRTRSQPTFVIDKDDPSKKMAIPATCAREACVDALDVLPFPRHDVGEVPS